MIMFEVRYFGGDQSVIECVAGRSRREVLVAFRRGKSGLHGQAAR